MNNISDELRGVQFKGLYTSNYSIIFNLVSDDYRINFKSINKKEYIIKCIKKTIKLILASIFKQYAITKSSKNTKKNIFLLLPGDMRKDIYKMFYGLYEIIPDSNFISFKKENSYKRFINTLVLYKYYYLFIWLIELRKCNLKFLQKVVILKELIVIFEYQYLLRKENISKYKNLIVYYDAHIYNNYFVQHYNTLGLQTITLQHGIMLAPIKELHNNMDFVGIEFNGFVSKYFLVWNNFTLQQALKYGIPKEKIKILGVIKCLSVPSSSSKINNRCFGLVLDGKFTDKNNAKMITIANQIAEKLNYIFLVRFHPAYSRHEFDDILNFKYAKICDPALSLYEYANSVEFSIVANSTALIELVFMNHPIFRYTSNDITDKYKDLDYESFSSFEEFHFQYMNDNKTKQDKIFQELCGGIKDVALSYKSFFDELGK